MSEKLRELAASVADPNERRWVNWRYETRKGETKPTKVPKTTSGYSNAKPNDPSTWSTLDEVIDAANQMDRALDGMGIVFTESKTLLGIDIDGCVVGGDVSPEITAIIEKAQSYTEISPSKRGLHIYIKLSAPLTLEAKRHEHYECYTEKRWFTVTGNEWSLSYPVRTVSPEEALEVLRLMGYPWKKEPSPPGKAKNALAKAVPLTDSQLLQRMFAAKNGATIRALYDGDASEYGNDESSADAALCSHLAFWTGSDAARIESLWLASPLGAREKTQNRVDYRKRTIESALSLVGETYHGNGEEDEEGSNEGTARTTQATQLVQHVTNNPDITLFYDDNKVAYVRMPVGDHFEIWQCGNSDFMYWLFDEYYRLTGKAAGANTISSALNTIKGRARAAGIKHKLHNRIAEHDDAIWYDLCDEKWRAIRVDAKGWSVVSEPPVLFRRCSYHEAQVEPARGGDVRELLRFVNVKEPDQQLLLLVYLIASFIPGFPHPVLYVLGAQGAAKSSLLEIIHELIDPSALGSLSLSKNLDDLKQALYYHSAFTSFDNVTSIDWDIADLLCRAVTGAGKALTFSYDTLYRLTGASTTAATSTPFKHTYAYDTLGSLLGWRTGSSATST